MALDQNAGQKRTVGLSRNLLPQSESPSRVESKLPEAPRPISASIGPSITASSVEAARTKKISFLADPKLEERFRKARLRAGFDKLEDAYNEAIKTFCDLVDAGKIDRF